MPKIPKMIEESISVKSIYRQMEIEEEKKSGPRRSYLGASEIGDPCERRLWYGYRRCGHERLPGRIILLLKRGQREEAVLSNLFKKIGCEVYDNDPATGKQIEISDINGHFKGHMDGVASGLPEDPEKWHVMEYKTHNARSFAKLRSFGVKESHPKHYAQLAVYMYKEQIDRGCYVAVCKDTDDIHIETFDIDECRDDAIAMIGKAKKIINSYFAPDRISDDPESSDCKYCRYKNLCHINEDESSKAVPADVSCRNCVYASPEFNGNSGIWFCSEHEKNLDEYYKPCDSHIFLPSLINFAKIIESGVSDGRSWIEYENQNGKRWKNGNSKKNYTSVELTVLSRSMVGGGIVSDVKDVFDCSVEHGNDI